MQPHGAATQVSPGDVIDYSITVTNTDGGVLANCLPGQLGDECSTIAEVLGATPPAPPRAHTGAPARTELSLGLVLLGAGLLMLLAASRRRTA